MKHTELFYNPFRLISPKLDAEANRLEEIFETPHEDVTCLEEGLIIMMGKIIEMTELVKKALVTTASPSLDDCERLAKEIHDEEKGLTGDLVCNPTETTGEVLKTIVLFPGRLERVGDLIENMLRVCQIKDREGVPFSDRAVNELDDLFSLLIQAFKDFRDALITRNRSLLEHIIVEDERISSKVLNYRLAHEDRLIAGVCTPKASSLFLDILDSVKQANRHIRDMCQGLLSFTDTKGSS